MIDNDFMQGELLELNTGFKPAYDFEDVWIIPRYVSEIKSRGDIDISSYIGNIELNIPIISAPMRDVCSFESARAILLNGGACILHRFCTEEEQLQEYKQLQEYILGGCDTDIANIICAVGISEDCIDRLIKLNKAGCQTFCIDVANGANIHVGNFIKEIYNILPNVKFITGNVGSVEGFEYLMSLPNVIGIRVNIGSSTVCTTRFATGIYHPTASLIQEIKDKYPDRDTRPAIIADGGVNSVANFCKAIALGADICMMGTLIAQTKESPAETVYCGGKSYKAMHGSASFEIQQLYKDNPKYIEGTRKLLDMTNETIEELFIKLAEGLRSSMSYLNALDISTYQNNAEFCSR